MGMSDIAQALRDVLREAREDAGLTFAEVAAKTEPKRGETVFRRLENGKSSPQINEIGPYVGAYVAALDDDVSFFDLWRRIIDRAEAATAAEDDPEADAGDDNGRPVTPPDPPLAPTGSLAEEIGTGVGGALKSRGDAGRKSKRRAAGSP